MASCSSGVLFGSTGIWSRASLLWLAGFAAAACDAQSPVAAGEPGRFDEYWSRGEAEVARYALTQSRYGEPREGHAVLVFVTEPFRTDLLVKDERGDARGRSTGVLKLNRIQRFATGVYDYSLMQSVFTPIDRQRHSRTLKTTTSVQDWCGHVWGQLELRGDRYLWTGHSYFEAEGEERRELAADVLLEDEIFTRLRLDPTGLPIGEIRVIPGALDVRLRHERCEVVDARAEWRDGPDAATRIYALRYPNGRTFEVTFERAFPHGIVAFRDAKGEQVTTATRTHVEMLDYWNHHARADDPLRRQIGLEPADIGRLREARDPSDADRRE